MTSAQLNRIAEDKPWAADLNRVLDLVLGNDGAQMRLIGYDGNAIDPNLGTTSSSGNSSLVVQNAGGNHQEWLHSGTGLPVVKITDAGLLITDLTVRDLTVTRNTILGGASGDALTVNATSTFTASITGTNLTLSGGLTVLGNSEFGNQNTDTMTFVGVTTFRNATNTATQLFVDAGNNRVVVGSGTTLGSDTTPNLQVIGRLYVAPESANDTALQIRRSSAATVGWTMGVENSPVNLAFKDDSGTKVFALGDAADTYQAVVTGDFNVTDDAVITGDITADRGAFGATTFAADEKLRVVGKSRFSQEGLFGGGITMANSTNLDGNGGTAGELRIGAVIVNAASLSGTEKLRVNGGVLVETGGVVVGGATGGDKGAGTINVSSAIYKNNTAYTNPHGGFERAYTGRIDRFGSRMAAMGLPDYRPLSLDDLETYTREHFHFPYFADEDANDLFSGGERLLLITEELAVHLFRLHHRVRALENAQA